MPKSVEMALKARPAATDLPLHYREEIRHPALPDPVTAEGSFDLGSGDTLIRRQTSPTVETTEIGTHTIKLIRAEDGYENTVLVPDRLEPFLAIMRAIVEGEGRIDPRFDARLMTDERGWVLSLTAPSSEPVLLHGCGPVLDRVTMRLENAEERRIIFVSTP